MTKVTDVITVAGRAGFFADDQAAIRAGARHDGFAYAGKPHTAGFTTIRQPGEALSVLLVLDDGSVEFGDCAAVQYSGAGGRDPVFSAAQAARDVEHFVAPRLVGRDLDHFRLLAKEFDTIETERGPLHSAVRYGVSQALLAAVARSRRLTMAEVVREEYRTGSPLRPVPLYAQTGDDRHANAEKMILKGVEVLPHALINTVEEKLGARGEILEEYLGWLVGRIHRLRPDPAYRPRIHVDTYGTVGIAFDGDLDRIAAYLTRLGEVCAPYDLAVEHPVDAGSTPAQIETYAELSGRLARLGSPTRLVVDEWCNTLDDIRRFVDARAAHVIHVKTPDLGGIDNTVEALLLVRSAGLEAYCGGTCNETDRSAQVCAHVAMACEASQMLAKPGMGVDEGLMIVGNEMARTAAIAQIRKEYALTTAAAGSDGAHRVRTK
jgi:methylaspartate ammonia-lyase